MTCLFMCTHEHNKLYSLVLARCSLLKAGSSRPVNINLFFITITLSRFFIVWNQINHDYTVRVGQQGLEKNMISNVKNVE